MYWLRLTPSSAAILVRSSCTEVGRRNTTFPLYFLDVDTCAPEPRVIIDAFEFLSDGKVIIMPDWYLYVLRCRDGSLYTGISTDVDRRLAEHQEGGDTGSKYLKGRGPLTLVFQKRLGNRSLASKVENKVKRLSKAKKEELICVPGYFEEIVKGA
jgi:putative endonuclease